MASLDCLVCLGRKVKVDSLDYLDKMDYLVNPACLDRKEILDYREYPE